MRERMGGARAGRVLPAVALAAAATLLAAPLGAQSYFGKNQVQYRHFKWQVIETEHFLVHYYPEEKVAAADAARMVERAYGRLSRILQHEFREKKPLVLFASRGEFGQNNVTGDLGEGTGGVTEALRHRMLLPFTGDYGSFERVLTHELVHEFQYDILARGKAGNLEALARVNPPLWFAEGMAEYLAIGPNDTYANTILRDAALNGRLPNIEQLTMRPDQFNPYDFGQLLWEYIGQRWGDEIIGSLMNAVPNLGVERAFKRELGLSLEDLGDEWREAMQVRHLPQVAQLDRARKFSQPLLTKRKSGGEIFLAPALSSDGKYIAFLSNGSLARGEVFIDLHLANAQTGQRIKRLVKSTTNPDIEELRLLYSQSSFSPDGKLLAFTAQRKGRDVLYLLRVEDRKILRRIDPEMEQVTSPTWSPDGQRLAFTGYNGGISDLFIIGVDGKNLRRLTSDKHGDLQPSWSPDGKAIAFATDRGEETSFELLRLSDWKIALYHVDEARIEVLPGQGGHNINPVWAPDGRSLAFVSNRTGTQNLFLFDLTDRKHYQLTNVIGGVTAFTEYSPVISWARQADRLAFTYYENDEFTIWAIDNPRTLKKNPFSEPVPAANVVAQATPGAPVPAATPDPTPGRTMTVAEAQDTTSPLRSSLYRSPTGFRPSAEVPGVAERTSARGTISVADLLEDASMALPDTTKFKNYGYKVRFSPEYVARPSIGYERENYGGRVFGGTTIILSDLLANHHLAFAGEVNGRVSEARAFAAYTNLSRRTQYMTGVFQEPYFFRRSAVLRPAGNGNTNRLVEEQVLTRYIYRQAFGLSILPVNRFTRFEFGAKFTNLDRSDFRLTRDYIIGIGGAPYYDVDQRNQPSINYIQPSAAYVSDNVLWGYTAPIMGRRYRFEVTPTVGNFRWMEYLADYRRYDPLVFSYLTIATRGLVSISSGRDADSLQKYIGYPDLLRGYEQESQLIRGCPFSEDPAMFDQVYKCSQLVGSRMAVANAELRFPILRGAALGLLPVSLPPVEGLFFYDAGVTWFSGQKVSLRRPESFSDSQSPATQRYVLQSYGFGVRLNLFNFALLRWDYAIPRNGPNRGDAYWRFSLGPSF